MSYLIAHDIAELYIKSAEMSIESQFLLLYNEKYKSREGEHDGENIFNH